MKFSEIVDAAKALLRRKQRLSHRALAREFELDDAALQDLCFELIEADRVAADEGGQVLVWIGGPPDAGAAPAAVVSRPQPLDPALPAVQPQGERRQLTVMFCDLVGSTAMSERLDPEDLHRLVSAYQEASRQVVKRYQGHIAQYLGDGILAYFGYPAAHENSAQRGVQAGLDILRAVHALDIQPPLRLRIGIHTGPVVIGAIGEGARADQLALGKTPNVAARLQGLAEPDALIISADTHRLVQGSFECEAVGAQALRGTAEPIGLYRVLRQARVQAGADFLLGQTVPAMQGRAAELAQLQQCWQRALGGQAQLALISGEAGIGKSRLVQALHAASADDGVLRIVLRCSELARNSPLHPVIEQLSALISSADADAAGSPFERLEHLLEGAGLHDDETAMLLAALLSVPTPEGRIEPAINRQQRKARTLQALVGWLRTKSMQQAVLLVIEDLHWADPSTLELLEFATASIREAPLLAVMTHRPEFSAAWAAGPEVCALALRRLSEEEVAEVARRVAGRPLPQAVLDLLVRKTDGVPLFVEEMTKGLLEAQRLQADADPLHLGADAPVMDVPFSLQNFMASRLDRLGEGRRLAEVASVLGREFKVDLVQALSGWDAPSLQGGLQQLCAAGILLVQGAAADSSYIFKHALIRDAAYHSVLKSRRQQTHALAARAIERLSPQLAQTQPELLAHHYTEAALAQPAIGLWLRAGERAVERSANKEAIGHLSRALALVQTLPPGTARDRQELTLQLAICVPLTVTTSFAAPEVRQANARALALCESLGESSQLFPVMYGVWSSYQVRADYGAARPLAEQLLGMARHTGDDGLQLQAHRAHGIQSLHTGRFAEALEHCEAGFALYDRERHHAQVRLYWLDPGVGCLCYGAWALVYLGFADQALARVRQAVALAQRCGHAFSMAYALHFSAVMHLNRREAEATREQAQALLALATEQDFPVFRAWAAVFLGCALAEQGQPAEGGAMIREAQRTMLSAGGRVSRSGTLAELADVYLRAGEIERGLATVREALEFVDQSEERFYEAELHRLHGALSMQVPEGSGRTAALVAAHASLHKALAVARAQQARLWELRAALALAGWHRGRGEDGLAREALHGPVEWFSEGESMPDLREARALLASLSTAGA